MNGERFFFKAWRRHAGFSQKQLAQRLNVSPATISRIENDKCDFTGDYLSAFAQVCGCCNVGDPVNFAPPTRERKLYIDGFFSAYDQLAQEFRVADRSGSVARPA